LGIEKRQKTKSFTAYFAIMICNTVESPVKMNQAGSGYFKTSTLWYSVKNKIEFAGKRTLPSTLILIRLMTKSHLNRQYFFFKQISC
jgi:hypothetical protein